MILYILRENDKKFKMEKKKRREGDKKEEKQVSPQKQKQMETTGGSMLNQYKNYFLTWRL